MQSTEVSEARHTLGIDFMGPFRTTFLLVIVEFLAKWLEMFPLQDSNTPKILQVLREIFFSERECPSICSLIMGPNLRHCY